MLLKNSNYRKPNNLTLSYANFFFLLSFDLQIYFKLIIDNIFINIMIFTKEQHIVAIYDDVKDLQNWFRSC